MFFFSTFKGAFGYEFAMQLRRRSIWLVLLLASLIDFAFLFMIILPQMLTQHADEKMQVIPPDIHEAILFWHQLFAWFVPLAVGLVIADRLARERKLKVDELLTTFPASIGARLLGKFAGALLATLIPVVLLDAVAIAIMLTRVPDMSAIGLAIGNFAAVVLPGMVFASGLSLAIPVFLNVTVFQILFIGYWFWANLMSPRFHIPTLTGTMLNATGPWAQEAFFHYQWTFLILNPSVVQGIESIALLVGVGLLAILLAWGYLVWHKA